MPIPYRFTVFFAVFTLFASVLLLTACGGAPSGAWKTGHTTAPAQESPDPLSDGPGYKTAPQAATPATTELPPVKVAILLPLSGPNKSLGQSMLNAAQIALFDVGYDNFQLVPKDTKGTPAGARTAAQAAISENVGLMLGPVFSESVHAARPVVSSANINMIAFSTDWTQAGGNTFLMGFTPFDQVERVVAFAASQNINRIGILAPDNEYGHAVISAYRSFAPRYGLQSPKIKTFSRQTANLAPVVQDFARAPVHAGVTTPNSYPFDAVLMPVGGQEALSISNLLTHYGMPPRNVRRLGTGLMDDPALINERNLEGVWFAAPSPGLRKPFERKFLQTYSYKPPRLATLAYDATALAAILATHGLQTTGKPAFDRSAITNPNGFAGIDGIFRFRPNGTAERGLAVLEISNGRLRIVDNAPTTFETLPRM